MDKLQRVIPARRPIPSHLQPKARVEKKRHNSFAEVLQQSMAETGIRFSKHALERLEKRGVELSGEDLKALNEAVEMAASKGAKESLVLYNSNAFIVSVKNRTVITALDNESIRQNVFTNIDSAVIWEK